MNTTALLVIDTQNDYFPDGKFPQWNTDKVLQQVLDSIKRAREQGMLVIHVQHVANPALGIAPFFNEGTDGVQIHPEVLSAAPTAPIVIKQHADSFRETSLNDILKQNGIQRLLLCGMMTQNCITHTALSTQALSYEVGIIKEACTSVSEMIHLIALRAIAPRIPLLTLQEAFA